MVGPLRAPDRAPPRWRPSCRRCCTATPDCRRTSFGTKASGLARNGHKVLTADSHSWSYQARKSPPRPGHHPIVRELPCRVPRRVAKSHGRWRMVANSPSAVGHAESKLGELVAVRDTIELSGGVVSRPVGCVGRCLVAVGPMTKSSVLSVSLRSSAGLAVVVRDWAGAIVNICGSRSFMRRPPSWSLRRGVR